MGEDERGEFAARLAISFYCGQGHETQPAFAEDATVPEFWDCQRCGLPASQDPENPPAIPRNEPYKTHLAYVKERRSAKAGADILDEALNGLRKNAPS